MTTATATTNQTETATTTTAGRPLLPDLRLFASPNDENIWAVQWGKTDDTGDRYLGVVVPGRMVYLLSAADRRFR